MAGNKEGGVKAAATNKTKYGSDFYATIGAKGGAKGTGHTFAHGKYSPSVAGKKGGKKSKRGPSKPKTVSYSEHVNYHTTIDDIMSQKKPNIVKRILRRA